VYRDPRSGALLWVDVRELRLRFALSVNKLGKSVEGLKQGRLMYTQCRVCDARYFPPQVDCPKCRTSVARDEPRGRADYLDCDKREAR
jgi:uncharacterized OB-fold protein